MPTEVKGLPSKPADCVDSRVIPSLDFEKNIKIQGAFFNWSTPKSGYVPGLVENQREKS